MIEELVEARVEVIYAYCEKVLEKNGFSLECLTYDTKDDGSRDVCCHELELEICDKRHRRYTLCVSEVDVEGYSYKGFVHGIAKRNAKVEGELRDFLHILEAFSCASPRLLERSFVQNLKRSFGVSDCSKFPKVLVSRKDPETIQGLVIRECRCEGKILRAPRYRCTLKVDKSVYEDEVRNPPDRWSLHADWAANLHVEKHPDFIKYPNKRPRGWPSGGTCDRCGSTNVEVSNSMLAVGGGFWVTYTCLYCDFKKKKREW